MSFSIIKRRALSPLFLIIAALLLVFGAGLIYWNLAQTENSPAGAAASKAGKGGAGRTAVDGEQIPLWPENVVLAKPDTGDYPESNGAGETLVGGRKWHWASYVTRPTMTIYKPKVRNTGAAILVVPGGGFRAVAVDLEGAEICDWVIRQGMTCAMLKYRVPQIWQNRNGMGQRPTQLLALEDAQRAMGLLRHRAAQYGIKPNKIGVVGFSAGAYVAAEISNIEGRTYPPADKADQQSSRPNFAVIVYTARMLDNSKGRNSLELQPWVKISPKAPPTLIIHAMNDPVDNIRHPMAYALALADAGVQVDMRVYAKGGHAFGMRQTSDPITAQWPGQVKQWLRNIDILATGQ
jgi:acetyl esterase/lipase